MKPVKNRMSEPQTRVEPPAQTSAPGLDEPRKPPCPFCGKRQSRVNGTKGAHRSRICLGCGKAFSTVESVKK